MVTNFTVEQVKAKGFTKEVFATNSQFDLNLMIMPSCDFDDVVKAWDIEVEEFIEVNAWLFDWEDA